MNKLKLFEITFNKLRTDKGFMAYYLVQLQSLENKTQDELVKQLHCSLEDYFKLGLCEAPDPEQSDFTERITKIADYSNTAALFLTHIIQSVYIKEMVLVVRPQSNSLIHTFSQSIKQGFNTLTDSISGFSPPRFKVYQAALTTFFVFIFLFNYTSEKQNHSSANFFNTENAAYKDSIKFIAAQDKTYVAPSF